MNKYYTESELTNPTKILKSKSYSLKIYILIDFYWKFYVVFVYLIQLYLFCLLFQLYN
jgi:hypothetical protein